MGTLGPHPLLRSCALIVSVALLVPVLTGCMAWGALHGRTNLFDTMDQLMHRAPFVATTVMGLLLLISVSCNVRTRFKEAPCR